MKIAKLVESFESLKKLMSIEMNTSQLAWDNKKLFLDVKKEIEMYFDLRKEKIEQYGDAVDGKDNEFTFTEDNRKKVEKELMELNNVEVKLNFNQISKDQIKGNVLAQIYLDLDWLIVE